MVSLYLLVIVVGVLLIGAAVFDWEWLYCWWDTTRLLEALGGETAARWYCGLTGAGFILITVLAWVRGD